MTAQQQANRTADLILELGRARRQIAAVRAACERARVQYAAFGTRPHIEVSEIEYALDNPPKPAPDTSSDPREVPA